MVHGSHRGHENIGVAEVVAPVDSTGIGESGFITTTGEHAMAEEAK